MWGGGGGEGELDTSAMEHVRMKRLHHLCAARHHVYAEAESHQLTDSGQATASYCEAISEAPRAPTCTAPRC